MAMNEMEIQADPIASEPQKETDIKMWYKSITYEDAKVFIKTNIISAARSFIAIGFYLKCVRDKELFQEDGHASIWDFAHTEYGLSKSTASRYMTMNDRFSKDGNSPVIAESYKGFGKSQLQEMLSLNEEQLEQVTPESTVQEIRGMRTPKEMPYFEMEGQMDLTDFPEVLPETMQQSFRELPQKSQSFVMDTSDLFEEHSIAISQQPESVTDSLFITPEYESRQEESYQEHEAAVLEGIFEEVEEKQKQPELPLLKNNDQRAAFVDAYETWPLWIETVETGERYYRYDLSDGTSMVVKVYHAMLFDYNAIEIKWEDRFREGWGKQEYYLLQEGKFFRDCDTNRSQLIEKLKEIQKKGK